MTRSDATFVTSIAETTRERVMIRFPDETDMYDDDESDMSVTVVEITDELDLHHFAPREVAGLVRDYLDECVERGFTQVRIIHGKGIGNLRRTVHAQLDRHPRVREYRLGGDDGGGWGATIVDLHTTGDSSEPGGRIGNQ